MEDVQNIPIEQINNLLDEYNRRFINDDEHLYSREHQHKLINFDF